MDLGAVRMDTVRRAVQHYGRVEARRHRPLTCRPIAQPHPRPRHDLARHLRRLHHPLSTCCLASRWKEDMAFLHSFYVADDICADWQLRTRENGTTRNELAVLARSVNSREWTNTSAQ